MKNMMRSQAKVMVVRCVVCESMLVVMNPECMSFLEYMDDE